MYAEHEEGSNDKSLSLKSAEEIKRTLHSCLFSMTAKNIISTFYSLKLLFLSYVTYFRKILNKNIEKSDIFPLLLFLTNWLCKQSECTTFFAWNRLKINSGRKIPQNRRIPHSFSLFWFNFTWKKNILECGTPQHFLKTNNTCIFVHFICKFTV